MKKLLALFFMFSFLLRGCSLFKEKTVYIEKSELDDVTRNLYSSDVRVLLSCGYFDNPKEIELEKLLSAMVIKKSINSNKYLSVIYRNEVEQLRQKGFSFSDSELEKTGSVAGYARISYNEVNELLKKYTGISVSELKAGPDIMFLEEYGTYYCRIPQAELNSITIELCELTGDNAKVYFSDKILTAQKINDEWQIQSLTENPDTNYNSREQTVYKKSLYDIMLWDKIERYITLEEANEINKVFYFERNGELPEERLIVEALRFNDGDRKSLYNDRKSIVSDLVTCMAYKTMGERFLDKEHPYLTVNDAEEMEYIKEQGYNVDFRPIARIPYTEVDRLLQKYLGISLQDIEYGGYTNKYGVFYKYVSNTTPARFCCYDGYYTDNYLKLIGNGVMLTFVKTEDGYKFLSWTYTEDYYSPVMDPENINIGVYERNGTSLTDYTVKIREEYFSQITDKSIRYSNAVNAFDEFLKNMEQEQAEILKNGYQGEYSPSISQYGLYDMTGDGVPELLLDVSYGLMNVDMEMYMYINGQVTSMPVPSWANQHGPLRIMANGMIGVKHSGAGVTYRFNSYKSDGETVKITFGQYGPDDFEFNEKKVSQEEYNRRTQYYLAEFEKEADIKWLPYFEDIVY